MSVLTTKATRIWAVQFLSRSYLCWELEKRRSRERENVIIGNEGAVRNSSRRRKSLLLQRHIMSG